jgi:hypothetical protein
MPNMRRGSVRVRLGEESLEGGWESGSSGVEMAFFEACVEGWEDVAAVVMANFGGDPGVTLTS